MAATGYPVALNLDGKRVLLVGGGVIAESRLDALLRAGAQVIVVSPEALPRFVELARAGKLTLHLRPYQSSDLDGSLLVIAATDDLPTNTRVVTEAGKKGILTQAVDHLPSHDFTAEAIVRRGELQIGISTNGRSSAFARWMRERLDAELPAEYGDLLSVMSEVRETIKEEGPIPYFPHWEAAITDEVLASLRAGDREGATRAMYNRVKAGVPERVAAQREELMARDLWPSSGRDRAPQN